MFAASCNCPSSTSLVVKCVILASPGFVKDQFHEYMFAEAVKQDIKLLLENKPKFLLVNFMLKNVTY